MHRGSETYICHFPVRDKRRVVVDGNATIDADLGGGVMAKFQKEVFREILP